MQDHLFASQQDNVLDATKAYISAGFSVIPVRGKKSSINWAHYQQRRATNVQLEGWHSKGLLNGVAIVCGSVSDGLVVIDLDGDAAVKTFSQAFDHIFEATYRVNTANGVHVYLYSIRPVQSTSLKNTAGIKEIGIRSDGNYVVAPPSMHPSGGRYTSANDKRIMRLADASFLVKWLDEFKPVVRKLRTTHTPVPSAVRDSVAPVAFVTSYINNAVSRQLDTVRLAGQGERNETLFVSAMLIGQLVASKDNWYHRILTAEQAESMLIEAASHLSRDDGLAATVRTVRSGMRAGLAKPRQLPTPRPRRNQHAS